jgi:hypothetical protein
VTLIQAGRLLRVPNQDRCAESATLSPALPPHPCPQQPAITATVHEVEIFSKQYNQLVPN